MYWRYDEAKDTMNGNQIYINNESARFSKFYIHFFNVFAQVLTLLLKCTCNNEFLLLNVAERRQYDLDQLYGQSHQVQSSCASTVPHYCLLDHIHCTIRK